MDNKNHAAIFNALALFKLWNEELDLIRMFLLLCLYVYTKNRRRSANATGSRALTVPTRQANIDRILHDGDRNSQWDLRMDCNAFMLLCEMLKVHGGLTSYDHVPIEEKVLIFLRILAQNESNRVLQVRFLRSGETISRVFHSVLKAVLKLQHILYAKPIPIPEDCTDNRWKWFKGFRTLVEEESAYVMDLHRRTGPNEEIVHTANEASSIPNQFSLPTTAELNEVATLKTKMAWSQGFLLIAIGIILGIIVKEILNKI